MYIKTSVESVIIEGEELAMLITKTISKIYELGLYNEVINNPIYGHRWKKVIKEEL